MTESPIAELPGGPYDLEFFFDPGCPFAWQTSVWVRNVVAQTGLRVGWRFISLWYINADNDVEPAMKQAQASGLRYHRICAAARERFGNDAVGTLYRLYGESYWYVTAQGDLTERLATAAAGIDTARLIADAGLPADLIDAADDESYDAVIQAESAEAFERTGPDVGTPIITFDPPHGNSLFGPVISSAPDGPDAVRLMDAVRVIASYETFSEFKRTKRAPLELPLFD
ncbi:MAG: hypothetical protein GX868_15215 [Actinobacteria bacterium]|nr:hypothetical protein [Actinomycetota bacterium]